MMSKPQKLSRKDARLFYATRQVKFIELWKQLAAIADYLGETDRELSVEFHGILTDLERIIPVSPGARAEAHRTGRPVFDLFNERRQKRLQHLQAFQQHRKHDPQTSDEIKRLEYGQMSPMLKVLMALLQRHRQTIEDAEQRRIDDAAADILGDLDFDL